MIDVRAIATRIAEATAPWVDPSIAHLSVPFVPPWMRTAFVDLLAAELDTLVEQVRAETEGSETLNCLEALAIARRDLTKAIVPDGIGRYARRFDPVRNEWLCWVPQSARAVFDGASWKAIWSLNITDLVHDDGRPWDWTVIDVAEVER